MNSDNTAIRRNKPSRPLKDFHFWLENCTRYKLDSSSFYDIGCGRGDDIEWLKSKGYDADGYDPVWKPVDKLPKQSKFVTLIYVLNTIPRIEDRKKCVDTAWSMVKKKGCLFISTRTTTQIDTEAKKKNWPKINDGYYTKKKTFQRGFYARELIAFAMHGWNCGAMRGFAYIEENKHTGIVLMKG